MSKQDSGTGLGTRARRAPKKNEAPLGQETGDTATRLPDKASGRPMGQGKLMGAGLPQDWVPGQDELQNSGKFDPWSLLQLGDGMKEDW